MPILQGVMLTGWIGGNGAFAPVLSLCPVSLPKEAAGAIHIPDEEMKGAVASLGRGDGEV